MWRRMIIPAWLLKRQVPVRFDYGITEGRNRGSDCMAKHK